MEQDEVHFLNAVTLGIVIKKRQKAVVKHAERRQKLKSKPKQKRTNNEEGD
jgi:hypothetical protein